MVRSSYIVKSSGLAVLFTLNNDIFSCAGNKDKRAKGILEIEKRPVAINYDNLLDKKLNSFKEFSDDIYLNTVVKEYHDRKSKVDKGLNELDVIAKKIIDDIEGLLLKILNFNGDKFDNFKNIVESVFSNKIKKFSDEVFYSEGLKDQLLLCFLLKRVHTIFSNLSKSENINSTLNSICKTLSLKKLVADYDKKQYILRKRNVDEMEKFIPSFKDQTLFNAISDILNYIKSCFFAYSIFVANKVFDFFPMLSYGNMKINNVSESIFDKKDSCQDAIFFFSVMESTGKNNGNIAYIYRQILNSSLASNIELYNSLLNIEECIFTKEVEMSGMRFSLSKEYDFKPYTVFLEKLNCDALKKHKLRNTILGIYNFKVSLIAGEGDDDNVKLTPLKNVFNSTSEQRLNSSIKFPDAYSKRILLNDIKYILVIE